MAPSLSAPARGPTTSQPAFDIVSTYRSLLKADPDLTMPVAAIDSLVQALAAHPTTTISETLEYLRSLVQTLIASTPNPISLSAGTDLFQRYLASSLQSRSATTLSTTAADPAVDFRTMRAHLLSNARQFVQRAKDSRDIIAGFGRHFVRDGCTVLTAGGSRVVGALLEKAAGQGARFRVVYVLSSSASASATAGAEPEGTQTITSLRAKGIPVATIPESGVGYALATAVDMLIVGAEGVVENGGVISRLGTYQLGCLAQSAGKPLYVVAESHKFVRLFPLGQGDLPIRQRVLEFRTAEDAEADKTAAADERVDLVDFTPPEYISGIITESGVLTPSAVSEELIKIWF